MQRTEGELCAAAEAGRMRAAEGNNRQDNFSPLKSDGSHFSFREKSWRADFENDPKAVALQLAARAKVREGFQLAQQGEIDKAIAAFQKAQQYVPDIDLDSRTRTLENDPKAVAQQLAARAKIREGDQLAGQGDIAEAIAAFQKAQQYVPNIDLDPETRNTTENDPKAVAQQLAARAKVEEGGQLAGQGDIRGAIAAFQKAQQYVPNIDLDPWTDTIEKDPQAVAQQLAAHAKVREGGQLAEQGDIAEAITAFKKAKEYVPDIDLDSRTPTLEKDPKAVAKQLAARAKVREGGQLAEQGDIAEAIAAFKKAQQYVPDIDLDSGTTTIEKDPKAVAHQLAALVKAQEKIDEGRALAKQGDIEKALQAYAEAEKLDPSLKSKASYWNSLGWWNSLVGHPKEGLDASEQAVRFAKDNPSLGQYQDTRALARALTGDAQGAIKDFEAAIASDALSEKKKVQRRQWVDALRKGQQPFTPELLKQLKP